jgi:hypothetical protein
VDLTWRRTKGSDSVVKHCAINAGHCANERVALRNVCRALSNECCAMRNISVEPFHLERYIDERSYRFNNRATKDNPLTDLDRFAGVLAQISGKRLTYAELTGKVGETTV